jgi:hypothetical protein
MVRILIRDKTLGCDCLSQYEGGVPAYLFEAMVALETDWSMDLYEATDVEYVTWAHEHLIARCNLAYAQGRSVILAGVVINPSDLDDEVWRFAAEFLTFPEVYEENNLCTILGTPESHLSNFWSGLTT